MSGWLRGNDLSGRVARWTAAAALMGIVTFAGAMWTVLVIESNEEEAGDQEEEGTDLEELEEEAGEGILWAMLLAAPPSLAMAIGGAVWASRRAFAPLHAVTRAAREITAADLQRRIEVADTDGDLRELATAFNDLLERLDAGVAALDRHATDVSHEIRTPLAVSIAELEVSLRQERSPEQWQAQAQRTLDDLRGLAGLADGLLALARSSVGAGMPRGRVVIAEELAALIEQTRPRARQAGVELEVHGLDDAGELVVAGSAPLLRGAVANILDNAIKHGGQPGRVRLSLTAAAGRVCIRVDDGGPGLAAGERERVFEPFVRATGEVGGFGIGLAVARRSVQAHGGTIRVDDSPELGGASFVIALPTLVEQAD
ncbi:MAG: HAMP domain-containing protein [Myxococcales bacterium]|nr:HAMP domain-containing protein [Myxococcales bacterium]